MIAVRVLSGDSSTAVAFDGSSLRCSRVKDSIKLDRLMEFLTKTVASDSQARNRKLNAYLTILAINFISGMVGAVSEHVLPLDLSLDGCRLVHRATYGEIVKNAVSVVAESAPDRAKEVEAMRSEEEKIMRDVLGISPDDVVIEVYDCSDTGR